MGKSDLNDAFLDVGGEERVLSVGPLHLRSIPPQLPQSATLLLYMMQLLFAEIINIIIKGSIKPAMNTLSKDSLNLNVQAKNLGPFEGKPSRE